MNSYPVYRLEGDLLVALTNPSFPYHFKIKRDDRIYEILNPETKAVVAIELFDGRPDCMMMVYSGRLAENRVLAAIVEEMIIASGGRLIMGEELDQVL
jgi:hypothetical protein